MFAGGVLGLLLVAVLAVLLLGVALLVVLVTSSRPDALMSSELAAARRHAVTTSGVSLTLLLATPVVLLVGLGATTAVVGLSSAAPTFRLIACAPLARRPARPAGAAARGGHLAPADRHVADGAAARPVRPGTAHARLAAVAVA